MPPLPPGQPLEIFLPGPGNRKAYYNPYTNTYTTSRSYALRMQRGYIRGIHQQEARGKPVNEYQRRVQREQELYGQKPWERFQIGFERRYGFSYRYWRQLRRRWVNDINDRTSTGGEISPSTVSRVKDAFDRGWRDPARPEFSTWQDWLENRLDERLNDMIEYQDSGDKTSGSANYGQYRNYQLQGEGIPPELYWYH
jgi:hypothetical protein